ncbi:MAG: coproporphyrinogen III oxidase family protein [Proteobacteria bacterium]|nr:coproporphyrinogen III oxidase family protein [Pseudomonadota bacterium]MBU1709690.1 coproporphyrinogen III oxidase family protein [Pseudomonadota bacterium]
MIRNEILDKIRKELFYGSSDYTKNQPDLFLPHKFQMLAPSQVFDFLETVKASISEKEILLYVHLPFCFTECLFCNSFPHKAEKRMQQEYLRSLLKEIQLFSDSGVFDGKKAKCIYFGGGTPTSFANSDIKLIIDTIRSCIDLTANCNITSEAHPSTLADEKRVVGLAEIGINRISIGCQTFDQDVLGLCNRKNTVAQIKKIVKSVRKTGMAINIDMMTGLPGQSIEGLKKDLDILETIRPDSIEYIRHEIVNPLVIELYVKRPDLIIDNDTIFEMVFMAQEWMEKFGYEQNGRFSNEKQWGYRYYWLKELPIVAFGSRARSYTKTISFDKYEELSVYSLMTDKGIPPVGRYISLTKREQMYRTFFLSLQIKSGLDVKLFNDRYHEKPLDVFGALIKKLSEYDCIQQDEDSISLTRYGAYFVEDVCDRIIDTALKEESDDLVRAPHSEGCTSSRLSNLIN